MKRLVVVKRDRDRLQANQAALLDSVRHYRTAAGREAASVGVHGAANCLLVSIHANAGGGTGWEVYTSPGKTAADNYADIFFGHAALAFPEFRMRADTSDGDNDKEASFAILRQTRCPAVLTENFFMDNERDCRLLLSDDGRRRIAQMHVDAIRECIEFHEKQTR